MASGRKQRLRKVAEQQKQDATGLVRLQLPERIALGVQLDGDKEPEPYVSLKYYDPDHECFSAWQPGELKAFSEFIRKLGQVTWPMIYKSGGNVGDKVGFGYTPHKDRSKLPKHARLDELSPDITFFELRVTKGIRVHGFRVKAAFFLVWLDREHRIYPM